MWKVSLREMIAIVNNGAHPYKVTLSLFGDRGTLVAASTDSENVYTVEIHNLVYKCRTETEYSRIVNLYTTNELDIYVRSDDTVEGIEIPRCHMFWDVVLSMTFESEGAL